MTVTVCVGYGCGMTVVVVVTIAMAMAVSNTALRHTDVVTVIGTAPLSTMVVELTSHPLPPPPRCADVPSRLNGISGGRVGRG